MAYVPRRSPLVFEEFVPPSACSQDSTCFYLFVNLPGFQRQELKLQVDNRTYILVSGERQVRENKYKRFEQSFELPKDAHIEKMTGKLDGEILYISVPKKVEEHKEIKHDSESNAAPVSDECDDNDDESNAYETEESVNKNGEKFDDNRGQDVELCLRLAMEKLKKNNYKGVVVTAIFAFSLGVLVTKKFQSNGSP